MSSMITADVNLLVSKGNEGAGQRRIMDSVSLGAVLKMRSPSPDGHTFLVMLIA